MGKKKKKKKIAHQFFSKKKTFFFFFFLKIKCTQLRICVNGSYATEDWPIETKVIILMFIVGYTMIYLIEVFSARFIRSILDTHY